MAKKNNQNLPTAYFTQKNRDKLEGILFACGVVGMVVFIVGWLTYYWYYSMIGCYVGGSCIIAYIIVTAKKVKDDGYDTHVREFIAKNSLEPKSKYRLKLFDAGRGYVKIGKDRKIRSSFYCISEFEFIRDSFTLALTEIDFCATPDGAPEVKQRKYALPLGTEFKIEETEVEAPEGKRNIQYLVLLPEDSSPIKIPSDPSSCDTDEIIGMIKRRNRVGS